MSTLLLDRAADLAASEPSVRGSGVPGGPTLDDLISGVWGHLGRGRSAACPGCGEELAPTGTAAARVGSCLGCGAELS